MLPPLHQLLVVVGLLAYGGIGTLTSLVLRRARGSRHYPTIWGWLLAVTFVSVTIVVALWGLHFDVSRFARALAGPVDPWGLFSFVVFVVFLFLLPVPIGLAALWVRPREAWWKRGAVRLPLGVAAGLLLCLHLVFRGTCTVSVRDQYDRPVVGARLRMCGLGDHVTDPSGRVHLTFYGERRVQVCGSEADGYAIDARLASYQRRGSFHEIVLPAWLSPPASSVLLSRVVALKVVPGEGCYRVNVLRQQITMDPTPIADLTIRLASSEGAAEGCPWRVELEAPDGGVQVAEAERGYRLLAPERGYQASWRGWLRPSPEASNVCEEAFYLKARGGRIFARADIRLLRDNGLSLWVATWLNPTARRSLFPLEGGAGEAARWLRVLYGEEY